jgi:transcriptional regulator with XRE-family HTH domain
MAPPVATVTPLDALHSYENARTAYEQLTTDEMVARAVGSLDTVLRNWRHTIDAFADAMGVTRGTIYHWRNLKRSISPAQVYRACQVFCAPVIPCDLDEWADQLAEPAGQLFNLFYSPDQRAAVAWLFEHRPTQFEWSESLVA